MQTIKNVLAILAGWVGASVVIFAIEQAGHYNNPKAAISQQQLINGEIPMFPNSLLYWILSAYVIGSFAGGLISGAINRLKAKFLGSAVGALLMVMGIINMLIIPHPAWFWLASNLVYIPMGYLGGRIMQRKLYA